jgi:branched-chain amino acid transport system permease protein
VFDSGVLEMSQRIVIGGLIIGLLIAEPRGLIALVDRLSARAFPGLRRPVQQPIAPPNYHSQKGAI